MTDKTNTTLDIAQLVVGFLSENIYVIAVLIVIFIFKKPIIDFLYRLTNLNFKNGDSEFGLSAAPPSNKNIENKSAGLNTDEGKLEAETEKPSINSSNQEDWFNEVYNAIDNGSLDNAEQLFQGYALTEKDLIKLQKNKATYLYMRFDLGKDPSAIASLEDLICTATNEDIKLNGLKHLSFCLDLSMQYDKEVEIWKSAAREFKSQLLITKATTYLALALNKDGKPASAKDALITRLNNTIDSEQKALIFNCLSSIELALGNSAVSVLCKDKYLEFDPVNRDELFNSAYSAGNEGIDYISISNYLKLINIDSDNSVALNNLGAKAEDAGLNIVAVEKYKKSANKNYTLAMANQGYLLLSAGFIDEAEEIARKAMAMDDVHKNIYSLITAIRNKKEENDRKWNEISEKSLSRQKLMRQYIEQYYIGKPCNLEGDWFAYGKFPTKITIVDGKFEANWIENSHGLRGGITNVVMLTGVVSGSSFTGQYTKKSEGDKPYGLLGGNLNINISCLGFVSDNTNELSLLGLKLDDGFSLQLSRLKH